MDIETLKEHIKKEEGFRNQVYLDSMTPPNRTIGYGHLCLPNEKWDDDKIWTKSSPFGGMVVKVE